MAYTTASARQQLLDTLVRAADELAIALASLEEAYEQVDEHTADRLEQELFRPVQMAYGRTKRTHAQFAERSRLLGHEFALPVAGAPSSGARGFIGGAVEAAGAADSILSSLQDSMLPVEVGDAELRAGISGVRELLGGLRGRARELVRILGR